MKASFIRGILLSVMIAGLVTGCAPAATAEITLDAAWGRPSLDMPTAGGMYLMINNKGTAADKLLSGSSPACGSIEVHEMVMKSDGTMGMNLVEKPLEIAAGGQIELKPGGLHIMCIMKNDKFAPGNKIDMTLKFEKAGEKTVSVEIREK